MTGWRVQVRLLMTAAMVALTACQEELTTPGSCPGLCPGGSPLVFDTVITPAFATDSSFRGFVTGLQSLGLLVSDGLPAGDARGWLIFTPVGDTLDIGPERQPFTFDSVAMSINLLGRDTTSRNLRLLYYRLPGLIDSAITFPEIEAFFTPDRLIDSLPIPDSLRVGALQLLLRDSLPLSRLRTAPEDSGFITIGFQAHADGPTGVRLESPRVPTGLGPLLTLFVRGTETNDTTFFQNQTLGGGFVLENPDTEEMGDTLVLGGVPSARTVLRYRLPPFVRDTASIVRALLELDPAEPVTGLVGDPSTIEARGLVADLGGKSVASAAPVAQTTLQAGSSSPVILDVLQIVRGWRGGNVPAGFVLALTPEAATFNQLRFRSTRTGGGPRLRITYVLPAKPEQP